MNNPSPSLQVHSLVVFEQDGSAQLGVITGIEGSKARLLNMRGRGIDLPLSRLSRVPGEIPGEYGTPVQKGEYLLKLRNEGYERATSFPIEELWQFVAEETRGYSIDELTSLYFGGNTLENHLTLRFALYEDPVFFKRKQYEFEPRPPSQIEQLKAAEEAKKRKERQVEHAAEEMLQLQSAHVVHSSPFIVLAKEYLPISIQDSTFRLLTLTAEVAAEAAHLENVHKKEVSHLIELYERRLNKTLSGSLEERAYAVLREIGWFHKNTNLSFIKHGLPLPFSEPLLKECATLHGDFERHTDFTHLHAITIDDETTLDMDDAVSLEVLEDGYRVGVHITDVASLVKMNTPLDSEAKARATSLYFPECTVNMFPEVFAEQTASLQEGVEKPAVSCFLTFSKTRGFLHTELRLTKIKVRERRSYTEIDELLDPPAGPIGTLFEVAMSHESTRMERGAMKIPKREVKITLSDKKNLQSSDFEVSQYFEQTPARELVGEMMIMANAAMARFARDNNIPFIYRSQEAADSSSEKRLVGVPAGPAFDAALRSSLKRSLTSTTPLPHATLGLECYGQVTSPIRRYTDLVNQRQLVAFLRGEPLPYTAEAIEQLLHETSDALHRARQLDRETHRFWVLKYLRRKAERKESITGTVVRDDGPQYQIELDEVFILALLKANQRLRRGDRVELSLLKVDPRYDYLRLGFLRMIPVNFTP